MSATSHLATLDMGIWADDGTIWLPKALYPTCNDAKRWAVANCGVLWIDVRCRTSWMVYDSEEAGEETPYIKCLPEVEGAFACWEI